MTLLGREIKEDIITDGSIRKQNNYTIITQQAHNGTSYTRPMGITIIEREEYTKIYIGSAIANKRIYYMSVKIPYNSTGIQNKAILKKAQWNTELNDDEIYEEQVDALLIMNVLLKFISDKYPNITELHYTDMSTIEYSICPYPRGIINVPGLYMFTVNKTWYEQNFKVTKIKYEEELYEQLLQNIQKIKQEWPFEKFSSISYIESIENTEHRNEIKQIYNTSRTWQEFFSETQNRIGKLQFYKWLSHRQWFNNFLRIDLHFNLYGPKLIFHPQDYTNSTTYTIKSQLEQIRTCYPSEPIEIKDLLHIATYKAAFRPTEKVSPFIQNTIPREIGA